MEKYTVKQIDYVMELKAEGKTFNEIKDMFKKKFKKDLNYTQVRKIYRNHCHKYDFLDSVKVVDKVKEKAKQKIIDAYYGYVMANNKRPNEYGLRMLGVVPLSLRLYFGNMINLANEVKEIYPDIFDKVVDDHLLDKKKKEKIHTKIKGCKKFIITSVVNDKLLLQPAFKALKTWQKEEGGELIFMPCADIASPFSQSKSTWNLPTEIGNEHIILKDLELNKNLTLSSILLTAKQINPLTGLSRLIRGKGSMLLAAPKQHLEHIPDFSKKGNTLAIFTTGAITLPDYNTNRYLSERTGYIAEYDHCLGGIIVELDKGGSFHFRPIQFEPITGAFIDIDKKYHADGTVTKNRISLIRCGDYHCGETDSMMKAILEEIAHEHKPQYLVIEDFNNGKSISPFNRNRIIKQSQLSSEGKTSLSNEFKVMVEEANFLNSLPFDEIVFIRDNHSLFLERYLDYCEFKRDYENLEVALKLALELHAEKDITEAGLELFGFKSDKFTFLKKDESFAPNGIENSIHGFKIKGRRTSSPLSYDKAYGAINLGHTHTARMYRNVMTCGTMTYLSSDKIDYIEGASDWTHTMIFEHENGSRQLINIIKGKYRL